MLDGDDGEPMRVQARQRHMPTLPGRYVFYLTPPFCYRRILEVQFCYRITCSDVPGAFCPTVSEARTFAGWYTADPTTGIVARCAVPSEARCIGWDPELARSACGGNYRGALRNHARAIPLSMILFNAPAGRSRLLYAVLPQVDLRCHTIWLSVWELRAKRGILRSVVLAT